MRQLMQNIQTTLSGVVNREADIILIPDADLIPGSVKFPCVGIKDGPVSIAQLMGGVLEKIMPVEIYFYDRMGTDDDSIILFLALGEDIHSRLTENYLSGYVKSVTPVSETPIRVMFTKQGPILRKSLMYQYEREE